MSEAELQRTPLYERHVALGGRMVPFAGYSMPVQFEGVKAEHLAVRSHAGLFDVSHMGELLVRGNDASAVVNGLVTNDLTRIPAGRAQYTCCCNERGAILDDLIIYKRAEDDILVVCNASNRAKISEHVRTAVAGRCDFEDASDRYALIALQGPAALDTLADCSSELNAAGLKSFGLADGKVAGRRAMVARTGYTGEDGVEIFCDADDAVAIWDALLDAGDDRGVVPVGLGARDTLRLEARLSLYGNDIDETTNPIEAGLGWTVKLDGPDFVGKAALEQIRRDGPTRKLVGFEMVGRGIARHGYPLVDEQGEPLGTCTSGGPAPTVGKNIGLGYVPPELASPGAKIWVDCRGKRVEAVVVPTPFYKRPRPS